MAAVMRRSLPAMRSPRRWPGEALQAASYCGYATVYAAGGSSAVAQREAFEPEFAWQVAT